MLLRDFVVNDLKLAFNLSVQIISPSVRRCGKAFKDSIFEGSQCNSAIVNPQNGFTALFSGRQSQITETKDTTQTVNKLLFFEDVDVVFEDESDFYS